MRILAIFSVLMVLAAGRVQAQDCRCISIGTPVVNKARQTVTFTIKNSCLRRIWFYSQGFWMTLAENSATNNKASKLFPLRDNEPEFILMKWDDEQVITFPTDKLAEAYNKLSFSYSNTTHEKPRSLVGYRTYLCEKDFKNVEAR